MSYMKWINYILAGLLVLGSLFHYMSISSYKNDIIDWQNRLANASKPTTVVVGNDSTLVALALQVKKIKAENDAVKKVLKSTKSKARYWAEMAGSYEAELDSSKQYATIDTVFILNGDSITIRQFDEDLGLVSVAGNFDTQEPWSIRFTKAELEKFKFQMSVIESQDGTWRTLIHDASPGLTLEPTITEVAPYKPSWLTKIHLDGEIRSDATGGVGAGVGPWTGMYYSDGVVGLEYSWYPFRRK
jgi:hypothetical protein